jgi:hypothetical protein
MTTTRVKNPKDLIWPLALLLGVPLALVTLKLANLPVSAWLAEHISLLDVSHRVQHHLAHILFLPLGAMLVVLVRLTLGLRVLGPFRSILLAVAFQITGVLMGLTFLVVTIAIIYGIRPTIKALKLPYFGRITVMLSAVAVLMTLAVMIGAWLDWQALQSVAYFPIVVLCLVADAFARTARQEGMRSALWRGSMTALVAIALAALAKVPQLEALLIRYPELLLAQIAMIIVISQFMAWRLLEKYNPKVGRDEEDEFEDEEVDRAAKARHARTARLSVVSPTETADEPPASAPLHAQRHASTDQAPARDLTPPRGHADEENDQASSIVA